MVEELKGTPTSKLNALVSVYDNKRVLGASLAVIAERLASLSKTGGESGELFVARGTRR